ncbi:MAG: hypothetical protein AB7G06_08980 [Bdellovibrionales bacterium]
MDTKFKNNVINLVAPDAETMQRQLQARLTERPDVAELMQQAAERKQSARG